MAGFLRRWWQRLMGRPRSVDPQDSTTLHAPAGAAMRKPGTPTPRAAPGELTLADDSPAKATRRSGKAGFDPYSSDAGHSKPKGWDRLDHD